MDSKQHADDSASTLAGARTKRYVGEEAQRVTWRDCRAANELAAKMLAGQIDPMSIIVPAPTKPLAVMVDAK